MCHDFTLALAFATRCFSLTDDFKIMNSVMGRFAMNLVRKTKLNEWRG